MKFTSTPPADPEFGSTYRLEAAGGSGKGIVFSIAPATTHHACSLDDAGTTATFDHAGTCVIAAHQTNRSPARAVTRAADDVLQTIVVPQGRQTITLSPAPGNARVAGPDHTMTVRGGRSGEDVVLTTSTPAVCTVSGRSVSFEHAGPCEIAADQAGNHDYRPAPTVTERFDVLRGFQTIGFTVASDRRAVGGSGTLRVTDRGDSGNPVTFTSTTPGACTVAGGTVSFDHARACTIEATQAGNDDYRPADAVTRTLDVDKADQQVAFTLVSDQQSVGGSGTLQTAAQGDSGNPVTFTSTTPGACTVAGDSVSFDHARVCTVEATQAGNDDYRAAPAVEQSVTVAKAAQSIDLTSTAPASPAFGDTYDLSATSTFGGPVDFSVDPATTSSACTVAGATVTFSHAGTCVIAADQAGDDDHLAAPTVRQSISVGKATQSITFTSQAPKAPAFGDTYVVSATGGASGNPVTFGSDSPAVCAVDGSTVTFGHAGTCVITAAQAGNDDYDPASAQSQTVSVPKASQTITFTSTAPTSPALGSTYAVSATSGSGDPVTFSIDPATTRNACTVGVDGTTVTFGHAGTCVIAADQAGNDDYLAAPTVRQTIVVAKVAQTITFTSTPPAAPRLGSTYVVSATGGGSGNPVTFGSTSPAVCTVAGSTVTFRHAGTCVITADQAGNDDYAAAPTRTQSVVVPKVAQTITFTSKPPAGPAFGDTYAVSATGGDSGNPVRFSVGPATTNSACTVVGSTVTFRHAGTCVIVADQAGNDDYAAAPSQTQSVSVGKAAQSITVTSKAPASPVVGGTYAVTATSGSGEPVSFSVAPATTNAACTVAGSTVTFRHVGTCVIAADQAGNDDYLPAATVTQSVAVSQAGQTITFTSSPPSPARVGTTYTATATSTSGLPVTFTADPAGICTATSAGVVTFKGSGDCVIRADQAGNADFTKAPTATQKATVSETRRDLTMNITTRPGLLFGIFGTVVDVQVVGLDPGAHATLSMFAHHAVALAPASCDANGDNNHAQCDVTSTPTTFSFLALAFQSDPRLDFEVSSKDSQDSNPDNNKKSVHIGD